MSTIDDDKPSAFSAEVGRRLRAVRRAKGLSLDEVERRSEGRWSASAIGAYERGFRNLSLPRLQELAGFYRVKMASLLGETDLSGDSRWPPTLTFDLEALSAHPEAAPLVRFLETIVLRRGALHGSAVTIRHDDLAAACAVMGMIEGELFERLQAWDGLVASSVTESPPT